MDTYEKKYKKLVSKIEKAYLYAQTDSTKAVLEEIRPELKESEDERIRKVLVDYFKRYKEQEECGIKTFYGIPTDNIITWLEKQGEQKPAWGEEDEYILLHTINDLKFLKDTISIDPNYAVNIIDIEREIDWLKSLKNRITWKPSDGQMKALHDLNLTGNLSYAGQGQVLVELYNDLKNLKEE